MSYIETAHRIWVRDQPLPVDLAMRLLDLGYDLEAIENKCMRYHSACIRRFENK